MPTNLFLQSSVGRERYYSILIAEPCSVLESAWFFEGMFC